MNGWIIAYITIIGMCLGSFFLVVAYRLPKNESLLNGSHCESCQSQLTASQLIPVVSYLKAKGKCRFCQAPISRLALWFELLGGGLFALAAIIFGNRSELWIAWSLISLLLIISGTDILYRLIPNNILLTFLILGIVFRILFPQTTFVWYPVAGFLAGFLPLYILGELSNQGMGGGDIKLFAVLGVYIGPLQILIVLFVASCLGIIYHIFRLLKWKNNERFIAFGPFIAIATMLVYLTNGWLQ